MIIDIPTLRPSGSPAPRSRLDGDRGIRLPRWEATGSGGAEAPIEESAPSQPTGRGRFPRWRISEPEPRPAREPRLGRACRILGTALTYIAHPSFEDPRARDAILAPAPQPVDRPSS